MVPEEAQYCQLHYDLHINEETEDITAKFKINFQINGTAINRVLLLP